MLRCNLVGSSVFQELDFAHEAENADRCAANFRSKRSHVKNRIHIPKIYHKLSTKRVLAMEYINGKQNHSPQVFPGATRQTILASFPAATSAMISSTDSDILLCSMKASYKVTIRLQSRFFLHSCSVVQEVPCALLTKERTAGVKVTDKELLEWGKINPQEVAKLVSEAFNEMIFSFG